MASCLFLEYPKCSTCQKARRWLEENHIDFTSRHIVEQHPSAEELKLWIKQSGLPLKNFFNTSGLRYKALDLKNRLPEMSEDEQIKLLATDGMLIKRPLLICPQTMLCGFRPVLWQQRLK